MALGLYHWRNSYRFISGFEFLKDYLKNISALDSDWRSPWQPRVRFWHDLQKDVQKNGQ